MVCLCYLPKAGRLTITIIKGHNLKAMDITGKSDPYVKVYLLCQGKRIRKKKTSVKYNILCPVFNEALVFDVPEENINEVSLVLKVIDYDRIGLNELMGCLVIGPTFIGKGRDHWTEMLDNPRRPVAQWYPLMESIPSNVPPLKDGTISLSCLNGRATKLNNFQQDPSSIENKNNDEIDNEEDNGKNIRYVPVEMPINQIICCVYGVIIGKRIPKEAVLKSWIQNRIFCNLGNRSCPEHFENICFSEGAVALMRLRAAPRQFTHGDNECSINLLTDRVVDESTEKYS
ncbi:hypothetical protein JTB14_019427 [Gonioctena quinquepunctata]|nr:hypothetical protein JTB14_019427 [Gonioctena quinquepunctata]